MLFFFLSDLNDFGGLRDSGKYSKKWHFISGITGNFAPEWVATLKRNGGNFAPDYAAKSILEFLS